MFPLGRNHPGDKGPGQPFVFGSLDGGDRIDHRLVAAPRGPEASSSVPWPWLRHRWYRPSPHRPLPEPRNPGPGGHFRRKPACLSEVSQSFRLLNTCSAYLPAGTVWGLPMAIFLTSFRVRSENASRREVDAAGIASTTVFPAKFTRVPGAVRPFRSSSSISFCPAEANTSTGAPPTICRTRSPEAPKLNCTRVPFLPGFKAFTQFRKGLLQTDGGRNGDLLSPDRKGQGRDAENEDQKFIENTISC